MKKPVLIITAKTDVHADFVIMEINKLGGEVIRLNTEDLMTNADFFVGNGINSSEWQTKWLLKDSKKSFAENSFDTIWYRKPEKVKVALEFQEEHAKVFVEEEYDFFLRSFYNLLSHKRWVNPFWAGRQASQKLPNLLLAAKLGLNVPKTIITNEAVVAKEFGELCNWNLIVKTFHFSGFVINETQAWHCFAKRVTPENFEKFADSIRYAPTFLQQYIDKSIELRVTIMDNHVFTAALHSQENERAKDDWRAMDSYQLKHTIYELPPAIEEKLLAFNRHYGLIFSTFDLILTPDGDYYFLECNSNGQWYWVEDVTKMPMARTMAELLLQ